MTARPTPDEKHQFAVLAASRGISESKLALVAIRELLSSNPVGRFTAPDHVEVSPTDRITIRLRPGDGRAIAARAELRGLKPSTYISGLVRAHVTANPPLAVDELQAVKGAVAQLTAIGGALHQVAHVTLNVDKRPRLTTFRLKQAPNRDQACRQNHI